jgi:DNA-binding NarL/FixJ family response regulator
MGVTRVVILNNRSLLAAGVQRLLQSVDGLELAIVAADDPRAAAKLRELAPKVIVLDSGDASLGEGVVTRMLRENPQARVVTLNLNHAGIDVYRMRRVQQTNVDGLLEAIHGKRNRANNPGRQQPRVAGGLKSGGETMPR